MSIHDASLEQADTSSRSVSSTERDVCQLRLRSWWRCWEIYVILGIAAFLRLYQITTTEFDGDQANIFRMAHDAIRHGHLVATSNVASLKIYNPPGIIYLLMLPAAISSHPVGGAILTAVLAILAVVLTHFFIARYYGRLAGSITALLYATAALPIFYARFMWQQNILLFFAPLFIAILYRGAVERRTGWFGWALFLLSFLVQLHGSGLLFAAPLMVAWVLAPQTVRWRDMLLGAGLILLSYAPYILWEIVTGFSDVSILLSSTGGPVSFDFQSFVLYYMFLSPLNEISLNARSLLFSFAPWFKVVQILSALFVIGGVLLISWQLVQGKRIVSPEPVGQQRRLDRLKHWWRELSASPYRCGLAILLVWQLVPLLVLIRHSIDLYPHYFILLMPGPFILLALFIVNMAARLRKVRRGGLAGRLALLVVVVVIALAQLIGGTASMLDLARGNFVDRAMSNIYYNDLQSLENALAKLEQVVQQQRARRISIHADLATFEAFHYLERRMQMPVTIANDSCVILPDPAAGPLVMLVGPYSDLPQTILSQFADISLVGTSERLGGAPFRIYVVRGSDSAFTVHETLKPDLQLLGSQPLMFEDTSSLLMHWRFTRTLPARDGLLYAYDFFSQPVDGGQRNSTREQFTRCTFTSIEESDRLLVNDRLSDYEKVPEMVRVETFTTTPSTISLGRAPVELSFDTYKYEASPRQRFVNEHGDERVNVSSR